MCSTPDDDVDHIRNSMMVTTNPGARLAAGTKILRLLLQHQTFYSQIELRFKLNRTRSVSVQIALKRNSNELYRYVGNIAVRE